ncbi:GNAT family N-acetyltransferase [Paractinoplanes lichenicola]|nr:GNAT family N-acetyltransferase [Actinoplanes lichenicola]
MTVSNATIRSAVRDDAIAIADVLTTAFLYGDLATWLIPHPDTRARVYRPYFALLTEQALDHGQIDITYDPDVGVTAVALWYPIADRPVPAPDGYQTRLAQITGEYLHRFTALDQATHRHHPYTDWHHYLGHLAVRPDFQRRGLGGGLLRHHHRELDRTGTAAYLEATGSDNSRLYAQFGYQPCATYHVTPAGPALFPMWRPARLATPQRHKAGRSEATTPFAQQPSRPT